MKNHLIFCHPQINTLLYLLLEKYTYILKNKIILFTPFYNQLLIKNLMTFPMTSNPFSWLPNNSLSACIIYLSSPFLLSLPSLNYISFSYSSYSPSSAKIAFRSIEIRTVERKLRPITHRLTNNQLKPIRRKV